jgi:hypothetical protein
MKREQAVCGELGSDGPVKYLYARIAEHSAAMLLPSERVQSKQLVKD